MLVGTPSAVVTNGFGPFSSASLLITRGFGAAIQVSVTPIVFTAPARLLVFTAPARSLVFSAWERP